MPRRMTSPAAKPDICRYVVAPMRYVTSGCSPSQARYSGPWRPQNPGQPSPDESVDYCSGCRVCNEVCPTGVKIMELNTRAKAALHWAPFYTNYQVGLIR